MARSCCFYRWSLLFFMIFFIVVHVKLRLLVVFFCRLNALGVTPSLYWWSFVACWTHLNPHSFFIFFILCWLSFVAIWTHPSAHTHSLAIEHETSFRDFFLKKNLVKFRTSHAFSLLVASTYSLSNMFIFSNQTWNLTHTFSLAFKFRTSLIPISYN